MRGSNRPNPARRSVARLGRGVLCLLMCTLMGVVVLSGCDRGGASGLALVEPGDAVGGPGSGPGRFGKPRAIDSLGSRLVVIDRTGRVQVLDSQSGHCLAWFRLPDIRSGFPTGVTIAPSPENDGNPAIWIPDTHMGRVTVYAMPEERAGQVMLLAAQPRVLAQFGSYGNGPGEFIYPSSVCVLTKADGKSIERVYVSEFGGNDRVSIFAPSAGEKPGFTFVSSFGSEGAPAEGQVTFQRPQTVRLLPGRGEVASGLLVVDSINHRLGVFTLEGELVKWAGGPGQFSHPRGVSVLGDGSVLVVEFGNNRVQHVDISTGQTLGLWGRAGSGRGELAEPWAIALVGAEGFIVDALNHRLVRMRLPRPAAGAPGTHPRPGHGPIPSIQGVTRGT